VFTFIGIEKLAANALIELMESSEKKNSVSFNTLINYGNEIVKVLINTQFEAVLLISRDYTNEAIRSYSDFFSIETLGEKECFVLKKDKTAEDLRKYFRGYLSTELLLAFTNINCVKVLKSDET